MARELVGRLRDRIARVHDLRGPEPPPRVLCLEWLDPLFVAGHWVPEMVALAGGADGLGRARKDSYVIGWDQIVTYAPEVIIVMLCGFDIERTRAQIHLLTGRPDWDGLPAVRTGRVFLTDASAYFSRPGPRIVRGLEILAGLLRADSGPPSVDGAERLDR